MKVNKEVNRIRKEMENENYETLFKNVAGVVQERAEAAGRDLELCHKEKKYERKMVFGHGWHPGRMDSRM